MRYWDEWLARENASFKNFPAMLERQLVDYARDPESWNAFLTSEEFLKHVVSDDVEEVVDRFGPELAFMVPFLACGKVIIRPAPSVSWLLANTRLTVPTNIINPPFRCVYVDLTEADMRLRDVGDELVMGAFLCADANWELNETTGLYSREAADYLRVSIVVKPREVGYLLSIIHTPIIMRDEKEFEELIEDAADPSKAEKNIPDELVKLLKPIVRLCFGMCLYLSHPELAKNVIPNMHPKREACLRDLKNGEVTGQVRAMVRGTTSVIKVNGLKGRSSPSAVGIATDATRIPHWRRGHSHTYWVGPGRKIKKELWIAAVLVNADLLAVGETVKPKTYRVT